MEWVTYKFDQFHLSRRGSRAHHHRAKLRECRFSGRDSETPLCHTGWLLGGMKEGWRRRGDRRKDAA